MYNTNKYYKHRALERAKNHLYLDCEWGRIPFDCEICLDNKVLILKNKLPILINIKDDFKG